MFYHYRLPVEYEGSWKLMKISVITPVLNGVRFLRKTIESVLSQKGDFEVEYIIKDGGSIDGTLEVIQEFTNSPSLHLISKKDSSLYDAINQGFEYATGDIGCWINADDYYEPNAFQNVVEIFSESHRNKWTYGHCGIVNGQDVEHRKFITWYKNTLGKVYSYNLLLCENYINQPATFWKMDLWKSVGGLDLKYPIAADYHLWLKFAQYADAIPLPKKLANFRRCGESISDTQFELQFRDELAAAKNFCNAIHYSLHAFNSWKTITAYKILRTLNL